MAKKNFKNPAEIFISDAEQETQKHEKTKNEIQEEYIPPKGFKLVKESKTERMQLLVRPATKAAIKQESLKKGASMNDLINQILDEYIDMQLLVRPATKAAIKQESLKQGISINDLINQILDQYIERNIEA